jgi:hypothetical protein
LNGCNHKDGRKFATLRNRQLFSLQGQLLDFHLENLDGRAVREVGQPNAAVKFKKLAKQN